MNFPPLFFNDINHGYRADILKKKTLWLLPFYMVVSTYFHYEKVRRTMRTVIVSNLLNSDFFETTWRPKRFYVFQWKLNTLAF